MYSPKIKEDLIPVLYKKAKAIGTSMTVLVDNILRPVLEEKIPVNKEFICHNCRMQIEIVGDDNTGYCNHCESAVFVENS